MTEKERQSAKAIREYYDTLRDKEIAELRSKCKHESVSDWVEEWWALGHSTGFEVLYCEICEATLSRKTHCRECNNEIVDNEIFKDDGQKFPLGGYYCKHCYGSSAE